MNIQKIIQDYDLLNYPIGLHDYQTSNTDIPRNESHLIVFDEKSEPERIIESDDGFLIIHHASLSEIRSKHLLFYHNLQIIQDESWELQMLLSKIKEKCLSLYADFAKTCLIESIFCCQKTRDAIKSSDVFAPCWQKCASYFLSDAISSLNHKLTNPFHMLGTLRNLDRNSTNEHIPVVIQTVGIERATPTLLNRMLQSTIGFSNLIEKNNHSQIIQKKYDLYMKNSMPSDCYFYLGHINKENFVKIKNNLTREPDLIHILKIAFDIEADAHQLLQHVDLVQNSCNTILEMFSKE